MGNYNSIVANTSIDTDMVQISNNTCSQKNNAEISNNFFVAGGDVNLGVEVTGNDFSCTIYNNFDESVINSIVNSMSQSASSESGLVWPFPSGLNSNSTSINNNISTHMQQIMTNNCSSVNEITFNNNFVSSTKGAINAHFIISGNPASCSISNIAKMTSQNSVTDDVKQVATITNAITGIVYAIVIGVVVYYSAKAYAERSGETTVQADGKIIKGSSNFFKDFIDKKSLSDFFSPTTRDTVLKNPYTK